MRETYAQSISRVEQAMARLEQSDQTPVLVETLELGGEMIKELLTDPLLPDAMLGGNLRQQLISMVTRYDAAGRARWRDFMDHLQ